MLYSKKNKKRGFTLVEMMVSVAIFSIIMTVGIGALVSIVDKYNVSQQEKKAADSLNFVLESLTREIRLGRNYYSGADSDAHTGSAKNGEVLADDTSLTHLIGLDAADSRGYMIYYLQDGILYRRRITATTDITDPLTNPSDVFIESARIRVMNAEDPTDLKQPLVWIQFLSYPKEREDSKKIIQTLVSQRVLDA